MSTIKNRITKFYRKPVPNDITFDDVKVLAEYYGCAVKPGGNHMKVVHQSTGTVIPIPIHGKTVKEAYIKELKKLFDSISAEEDC